MKKIKLSTNISCIKASLANALGNKIEAIDILKNYTGADHISLLWYDDIEKSLIDKLHTERVPIKFLQSSTKSMLSEAYKSKTPYNSTHLHYEAHYNVAIDNPYKLDISAQLIMPLFAQEQLVGIIRFSKSRYTFPLTVLQNLQQIESSLTDIFSQEIDARVAQLNESFFSVDAEQIYGGLDIIRRESKQLSRNTHNPEVRKLIQKIDESVKNICNYIRFNVGEIEEMGESKQNLHILIADDVHMNVKILHAMLSTEKRDIKFSFAYDGTEALKKINSAKQNNKPVDILYLDHYMPGKLGLEVAQLIREAEQLYPNHKTTIVSITNDPSAIESQRHLFDYHIEKPFSKASITSLMEKVTIK